MSGPTDPDVPGPGLPGPDPGTPGLQVERTRLSWRRSLLATGLVTLLVVRALLRRTAGPEGSTGPSPVAVAAAALATLSWCGLALLVRHRRRGGVGSTEAVPAAVPALAAAAVVLLAVLGLAATVLR